MQKSDMGTIVNVSIWQTLSRTVNTTVTTLIAVVTLFIFAAVNNITSIKDFSLSLIVGCIAGSYSSVFIAANLWHWWRSTRIKSKNSKVVAAGQGENFAPGFYFHISLKHYA